MIQASPFEIINGLTFNILGSMYRFFPFLNTRSANTILCYHSVGKHNWRFTTPTDLFESHIKYLSEHYNIVTLDEMLNTKSVKNSVAITFDDAYLDVYTNAMPILKKYNARATVFAIGKPKQANRVELDNNLPFMNIEQLKELVEHNWEIGYHTATHPNLSKLSKDELYNEVVHSKHEFEREIGLKIRYFAYPKGMYNKQILATISNSDYEAAFTVDGGTLKLSDRKRITRIPTEGLVNIYQLDALISPAGQHITAIFMLILKLVELYKVKLLQQKK